jgi:hypothetical protein
MGEAGLVLGHCWATGGVRVRQARLARCLDFSPKPTRKIGILLKFSNLFNIYKLYMIQIKFEI